jgi:hypothetical protein
MSERAGRDVGTEAALAALATGVIPTDSAAKMAVAETPTAPMSAISPDEA